MMTTAKKEIFGTETGVVVSMFRSDHEHVRIEAGVHWKTAVRERARWVSHDSERERQDD